MDKSWLESMFRECGLEPEEVGPAADATLRRLLRREQASGAAGPPRPLIEALVRDPLISMHRIIGRGEGRLPFIHDEAPDRLSAPAFGHVLGESGLDPVVAMAYAKVVAEAYQPTDLYQPIWEALGKEGPPDFEALYHMDWTPLRAALPDPLPGPEVTAVTQAVRAKPKARPPAGSPRPAIPDSD